MSRGIGYDQLCNPHYRIFRTNTLSKSAQSLFLFTPPRVNGDPVNPIPEAGAAESSWPELVQGLRDGDPSAMEDLYRVFSGGIRFYLWRQLGSQDLTDKVHDLFLIVTQS